jgi:hypothetical protein
MVWMDAWPAMATSASARSLRQSPRPELHRRSSHSSTTFRFPLRGHSSTISITYMLHRSQSPNDSHYCPELGDNWIQVCSYHYYVLLLYTIICLSLPHDRLQPLAFILHRIVFSLSNLTAATRPSSVRRAVPVVACSTWRKCRVILDYIGCVPHSIVIV